MAKPQARDPLAPLDTITGILTGLLIVGLAFAGLAVLFMDNPSFLGIGDDDVCVATNRFGYDIGTELNEFDRQDFGIRKHVEVGSDTTSVCDEKPGITAQVLGGLTTAPTFVVFLGFILLTRRTIRYAQKHGLFSQTLAERIERLGWLLLFGLIGAALIEWLAEGQLLSAMLREADWASGSFSISVAGIIGAYGLVSIGRIMNRAAALQADSDATI